MSITSSVVGTLLSGLHEQVSLPSCQDDWLSTTAVAGAVLAASPVVAALLVAVVRKRTGNRYDETVCILFLGVGLLFVLALPWVAFRGATVVYHAVATGTGRPGLSESAAASLSGHSCFVDDQQSFLGLGPTVYDAVFHPSGATTVSALGPPLLVGAPVIGLLFIMLQARAALRRGPKWPGRLLWLPFLALIVATAPLPAHPVELLWIGFVPASLLGVVPVLLVGPPRWSVLSRSGRRTVAPPVPQRQVDPVPSYPRPDPARTDHTLQLAAPAAVSAAGGRFRRIRTLGTGGFGTVWLALDTKLGRTVAVKFASAPDVATEDRMLREARALAAVGHPHCVRIYDVITEAEGLGIVMEYIEGTSLAETVQRSGSLDDAAAARLWATMADALDAAHAGGVLHRDIKPSNILLDRAGAPHLIDFGIARSAGDQTITVAGTMIGTPDYLAPEVARGEEASPASDAWQLAAAVSYALTGRPPRGAQENAMAAMAAAARGEPCGEIPDNSAHHALLAAELDTDPARRPALSVVRQRLMGWLASHDEEDRPTTVVLPVESNTNRSR